MLKQMILLLGLCFGVFTANAQGLLEYSENHFFDASTAPRIGIEIELSGLTAAQIGQILSRHLGGTLREVDKPEDYIDSKTGIREQYIVRELHLENSQMGTVVIKPEENGTDNSNLAAMTAQTHIFEIVTAPITFHQVFALQDALDEMKSQGAVGTLDGHAVAIQVNVEMGKGLRENIKAANLIKVLRNYLKPNHKKSIDQELNVPDFRKGYLGDFTPGMMARILDISYAPSNAEFFFDFMYRQSLELLGQREAWTADEQTMRLELQSYLEKNSFDALLPVYKYNSIRVSAVLMFLFPQDWLSEYLLKTTWFHQYPILEFRDGNNDFELLKKVKAFLGLIQQSERKGDFEFDEIISNPSPQSTAAPMCLQLFQI